MPHVTPTPGKKLLDPANHLLVIIGHPSQMAFATKSIDAVTLRGNAALVAKAARHFKVPMILATLAEKTFPGSLFDEIKTVFPDDRVIDRAVCAAKPTTKSWRPRLPNAATASD
jgi:hypothetical protein